jgi:hypothetical protein
LLHQSDTASKFSENMLSIINNLPNTEEIDIAMEEIVHSMM